MSDLIEEESGLTFGEFCKMLLKRWKLLIIILLASLVIVVLGVQFVLNPRKEVYFISFQVDFLSAGERFSDGTTLQYLDMLSLDNLQAAKKSDDKFADIDVEKLYNDDSFSLSYKTDNEKKLYTLSVKTSGWQNKSLASDFLKAVASMPVRYSVDLVNNDSYYEYQVELNGATSYEQKVEVLKSQYSNLKTQYAELMKTYTSSHVINGKSLYVWQEELDNVIKVTKEWTSSNENDLAASTPSVFYKTDLEESLESGGFVYKTSTILSNEQKSLLEAEMVDVYNKLQSCNAKITELKNATGVGAGDVSVGGVNKFAEYTEEKVRLTNKFKALIFTLYPSWSDYQAVSARYSDFSELNTKDKFTNEKSLYDDGLTAFESKLSKVQLEMKNATDTLKETQKVLAGKNPTLSFVSNKVEKQGGVSVLLSIVLSFVIGGVIAVIVILVKDLPAYRKTRLALLKQNDEVKDEA